TERRAAEFCRGNGGPEFVKLRLAPPRNSTVAQLAPIEPRPAPSPGARAEECMRAPWVAATVLLSTLSAAVALSEPVAPLRAASGQGGGGGRQCGTPAPDPFEVQQLESALSTRPLRSGVGGTIKVAFHVIYSGS